MRNIWLVVRHDVNRALRQRSFWVLSFLMPLLLVGMNAFIFLRSERLEGDRGPKTAQEAGPVPAIGLVDPAGLIATIPASLPAGLFQRFDDEAAARAALDEGLIEQYAYVGPDYLDTGEILIYDRNFRLLQGGNGAEISINAVQEWMLDYLIGYNLTGNEALVTALRNPTPGGQVQVHVTEPPSETGANDGALARLVANIVPLIFYILLLTGSTFLMQSVVAEKESRTAEVVLLSLDPRELMVGKLLAGTLVLLVQLAIWMGGALLALSRGTALVRFGGLSFPPGFAVWAGLLLVLGYLLYASIMAAVGALASTAREGSQTTWLLVVPFMPTLMFAQLFLDQPTHPLVVGLSLFPFSAPSAMVTRLAVGSVPLWQILLSLVGLAATAYLFVVLSARFFKAGNLLSGAAFNWRRLATGWRKE